MAKLPHMMDVDDWEWNDWKDFFEKVKKDEGEDVAWVYIRRLYQKSYWQGVRSGRLSENDSSGG